MQAATSRVFAFAATVLGFAGLGLGLLGGIAAVAGLGLAALALLCLLATAWVALERPFPPPGARPLPEPTPAPPTNLSFDSAEAEPGRPPAPEAGWQEEPAYPPPSPAPEAPAIDLDSPLQRALAGLPPKPSAPARYSPRMPVIPEDEAQEGEPVRRARRLVPSGQTLGEKREAAKKAKAASMPEEVEFTVVPAKTRRVVRPAVVAAAQAPIAVARVAGKGPAPANLARGKCSGCGTLLWAPKARPLNLRCPACDKMTLLK